MTDRCHESLKSAPDLCWIKLQMPMVMSGTLADLCDSVLRIALHGQGDTGAGPHGHNPPRVPTAGDAFVTASNRAR